MAIDISSTEPDRITAGDTVKWTRSLSDFLPADGWVLTYSLVIDGTKTSITSTDNGDGTHLVSIPASTTANWAPGVHYWQAHVTLAGERETVGSGRVAVVGDFAAGGADPRSHVKKTLDALEAVIEARATADQLSYTIAGRSLSKMTPEQLVMLHDRYKGLYAQELREEKINQGKNHSGRIKVRF